MYTWVRTAAIRDGKLPQAIEWAIEITGYVNENFGTNAVLKQNVTGKVNQLHWVVDYDSLADLERVRMATIVDEGMQQRLAASGEQDLFAANSIVDNIYASIP